MPTKAVSRNRTNKALRIIKEGRIEKVNAETFIVIGDSHDGEPGEEYVVTVIEGGFRKGVYKPPAVHCDCKWGREGDGTPCAHGESARIQMSRKEDPFEGIGANR